MEKLDAPHYALFAAQFFHAAPLIPKKTWNIGTNGVKCLISLCSSPKNLEQTRRDPVEHGTDCVQAPRSRGDPVGRAHSPHARACGTGITGQKKGGPEPPQVPHRKAPNIDSCSMFRILIRCHSAAYILMYRFSHLVCAAFRARSLLGCIAFMWSTIRFPAVSSTVIRTRSAFMRPPKNRYSKSGRGPWQSGQQPRPCHQGSASQTHPR